MAKRITRRESHADAAQSASSEPLRAIRSFYSPVEAHIVRGALKDAGIECALSNEFIALVDSPVSNVTGGVQVLVRAADVERASAVLDDPPRQPPSV